MSIILYQIKEKYITIIINNKLYIIVYTILIIPSVQNTNKLIKYLLNVILLIFVLSLINPSIFILYFITAWSGPVLGLYI